MTADTAKSSVQEAPVPAGRLTLADGAPLPAFGAVECVARISPGEALVIGWTLSALTQSGLGCADAAGSGVSELSVYHFGRPDLLMTYRRRMDQLAMPEQVLAQGHILLVRMPRREDHLTLAWTVGTQQTPPVRVSVSEQTGAVQTAWRRLVENGRTLLPQVIGIGLSATSTESLLLALAAYDDRATLTVDWACTAFNTGLLVAGLAYCTGTTAHPRLYLISATGTLTEVTDRAHWSSRRESWGQIPGTNRPAHRDIGYTLWLEGPEYHVPGARFRLMAIWDESYVGRQEAFTAMPAHADRRADIESLLDRLDVPQAELRKLLDECFGPAVRSLWAGRERDTEALKDITLGTPPAQPQITIIVPLYRRWDFIQTQLEEFRQDEELRGVELLYFIDDPSIVDPVLAFWREHQPAYGLPLRFLFGRSNLGYAGANNRAAAAARGSRLILMNSDVTPLESGWIGRLMCHFNNTPGIGAMGVRLLFEDGRLQHDSMSFVCAPNWADLYLNEHPGKGQFPSAPQPESKPIEVPAVTGACLVVDRAVFLNVGGFDEEYVRGDFEDSDFCLKVRRQGLRVYCCQDVILRHLERQSIRHSPRGAALTLYNAWLQDQRWHEQLASLAITGRAIDALGQSM